MANEVLDEFGRRFMIEVRDEAISDWEMILSGQLKGARAEKLRSMAMSLGDGASGVSLLVPEVVDTVLHHVLRWLEEDENFRIVGELDGQTVENVAEESDGLAGELYSEEGWIARFSTPT